MPCVATRVKPWISGRCCPQKPMLLPHQNPMMESQGLLRAARYPMMGACLRGVACYGERVWAYYVMRSLHCGCFAIRLCYTPGLKNKEATLLADMLQVQSRRHNKRSSPGVVLSLMGLTAAAQTCGNTLHNVLCLSNSRRTTKYRGVCFALCGWVHFRLGGRRPSGQVYMWSAVRNSTPA